MYYYTDAVFGAFLTLFYKIVNECGVTMSEEHLNVPIMCTIHCTTAMMSLHFKLGQDEAFFWESLVLCLTSILHLDHMVEPCRFV